MENTYIENAPESSKKAQWLRAETTAKVIDFEKARADLSQRQFAKANDIPRSTLQHWIARKNAIDECPEYVDFFESPHGLEFLHRMITAALFTFCKVGNASTYNLSEFIRLAGLEKFVAASSSHYQRVSAKMDDAVIAFGESESDTLAAQMPFKQIALAEDETFHPETCLVGIEPVSNFIIAEKYAQNRTSDTWDATIDEAVQGLRVEITQVVSDEARGLICHTSNGLGAHHSSDCFHVAYEISKGTSGALASAVRKTQKECDTAEKQEKSEIRHKENYENRPTRRRGRRPNFEKKIKAASAKVEEVQSRLSQAIGNQAKVRESKEKIGQVYHPYNLENGEQQDAPKVSELLEDCFEEIDKATENLSDRCKKRVAKAHRVVKKFVANIAFFFRMIDIYMDNVELDGNEKELLRNHLIPICYLEQAAEKERDKEKKTPFLTRHNNYLIFCTTGTGHLPT